MPELSICIITRNDAECLKKCLCSIKDAFGKNYERIELVVMDIGLTADAILIARNYTKKIYCTSFSGNFSTIKNFCIKKASCDNILFLNVNEYLKYISDRDFDTLVKNINTYRYSLGRIDLYTNYIEDNRRMQFPEKVPRIFNRNFYSFRGKSKEKLVAKTVDGKKYGTSAVWDAPLRADLDSSGLINPVRRFSMKRLLIVTVEREPETPLRYYELGKTEYNFQKYLEAYKYMARSISLMPEKDYKKIDYLEDALITYCYSALKISKAADALDIVYDFENVLPKIQESADFIFVKGLLLMNCTKFDEATETFVAATKLKKTHVVGTNSFMAWHNAGVICEVTGKYEEAAEYYKKCGDYTPAIEGLERIKKS